jgi:hypothetical protein
MVETTRTWELLDFHAPAGEVKPSNFKTARNIIWLSKRHPIQHRLFPFQCSFQILFLSGVLSRVVGIDRF